MCGHWHNRRAEAALVVVAAWALAVLAAVFVALALASRLESALGALAVLASFVALALAVVASSLTSVLVS